MVREQFCPTVEMSLYIDHNIAKIDIHILTCYIESALFVRHTSEYKHQIITARLREMINKVREDMINSNHIPRSKY